MQPVNQLHPVSSSTPVKDSPDARLKAISERTSYYLVRLAFHRYPQLIRALCIVQRFGPPADFHRAFTLAMGRSPGFGSTDSRSGPIQTLLQCRIRFRYASGI